MFPEDLWHLCLDVFRWGACKTLILLRSPQLTLHPKLPRLLPLPFRRGEGWGEGVLRVVYPTVLAVSDLGR